MVSKLQAFGDLDADAVGGFGGGGLEVEEEIAHEPPYQGNGGIVHGGGMQRLPDSTVTKHEMIGPSTGAFPYNP